MKALAGIKPIARLAAVIGALAGTAFLASCSSAVSASSAAKTRYAIVIGIEQYANINSCSYTENDANDMKDLLAAKGWTVVSTLKSASATKAAIESAIKGLASYIGSDTNATVLVYYSGHGDVENGTAYICPYDTDYADSSKSAVDTSTMISASEMSRLLGAGALGCSNKLLILDSCYSGGFVTSASGSSDTSSQNYGTYESGTQEGNLLFALAKASSLVEANLAATGDPDVLCISAAGSGEMSWSDDSLKNGVMSYYLIEAASKGDTNFDGYVSASEAFAYAKAKIKANWNKEYQSSTSDTFLEYKRYLSAYGYRVESWADVYKIMNYIPDFLPHISGGTGDLVLYDNS